MSDRTMYTQQELWYFRFIRFLKDSGKHNEFMEEVKKKHHRMFDYWKYCKDNKIPPSQFLLSGFNWNKTEAGHHIWDDLNGEWMKLLTQVNMEEEDDAVSEIPEIKEDVCLHTNKRESTMLLGEKFWYCPDCKEEVKT